MRTADTLTLDGIGHGFFTRAGGVSEGLYASLNCGLGSGDAAEAVRENRGRVAGRLGVEHERLLTAYQVHSPTAVTVEGPWQGERPDADALVTATPGLAVGVLTADCAPVLFADAEARVVGAAHAGWKGALTGVLEAAVDAMERLGARRARIAAAVGPCIAQASYEVGPEFAGTFLTQDPANAAFFAPGQGDRLQFDLKGYVAARLRRAGIGALAIDPADTQQDEARFFSFRRSTKRGEKDYGRLISAIVLEA